MIVYSTQDRVLELWVTNADITGIPANKNYYKHSEGGAVILTTDNDADATMLPLQQSSLIVNADTGAVYVYIVDSNGGKLRGQTGHWNEL